jgi:hypothetical protein
MRLEEGWEGRMNIVERGGALQGRMGAARLAQHRTEQSRLSTSIETLASQYPIRQVVFEEGEGEVGSEGGDGVG